MPQNRTAKGTEFERHIAFLYRSMGFSVETDVRLSGQQFDLIAEKYLVGGIQLRMPIECKYLSKGTVSNQHVLDFVSTFNAVRDRERFTHGAIVTNANFSRDAKSIVHASPAIALKTLPQLEDDALGLPSAYFAYTQRYENSLIRDTYIDLGARGCLPSPRPRTPSSPSTERDFPSIETAILTWAKSEHPGFLSILADFGSGKTTLLRRLQYLCCKSYLRDEPIPRPLFFPLRDLTRAIDLNDFMLNCARTELGIEIPIDLIWRLIRSGKALLLLDGFDEITTRTDRSTREQHFYDLAPLIHTPSKSIMTCRPAYFVSDEEYHHLLETVENDTFGASRFYVIHESRRFEEKLALHDAHRETLRARYLEPPRPHLTGAPTGTVALALLDDSRIDAYLRRHNSAFRTRHRADWQEVKTFLLSIYDVRDLMSRPLLLEMITEVLLHGDIDLDSPSATVGPSSLYENYTEIHFAIDWRKGLSRQFLTTEERRLFAQAIAWSMFEKASIEVTYDDIAQVVRHNEHILQNLQTKVTLQNVEEVISDIQICTFLTRVGKDGFRFVHRSFMEFFLARYIKGLLESDASDVFFDKSIPHEVLYFLGGFALFEGRFLVKIDYRLRNEAYRRNSIYKRNLVGVTLYSSDRFKDRRFREV
jgi:Restriction endonuclease/NACHT domain